MGVGLAIGGLAQGFARGVQMKSDLEDAEQKRELAKKAADREEKRFALEEEKMGEERKRIAAREEFQKQIAAINDDAANGRNGFEQYGYAAPQQQPQGAIAGPDGQPAPASANPFKATADGLYKNQRAADQLIADRRAAALEALYTKLGEPEKAMMAKSQMADLVEKDVERKTKSALAAAAIGAPGAMPALAKVYNYFNDGVQIDPNSGTFDPKTMSWKNVTFVDADGNKTQQEITQGQILGLAKRDASALAMFNVEQDWKRKEYSLGERKTAATEKSADAEVTKAGASVIAANAQASRASALNRQMENDAKGADQKAMVDAIGRLFPLATKEFKEEELMVKKPEDKKALLEKKASEERMYNKTVDLAGLNPRVDVRTLASIARAGKVDAQQGDDGRVFTMVGNKKIFLQ